MIYSIYIIYLKYYTYYLLLVCESGFAGRGIGIYATSDAA